MEEVGSYQQFKTNLGFEKEKQLLFDGLYSKKGKIVNRDHCEGWDLVVEWDGKQHTIEEKARRGDFDDILVEVVQDQDKGFPGWIYYSQAHYLVYGIFGEKERVYILPMKKFRDWFDFAKLGFEKKVSKKGYGTSINHVVPLAYIPPELIRRIY